MPVRYVCKNCGFVLWEFKHVGQDYYGVPTPEEVIRVHGVCPRCKRELEIPSLADIMISVREVKAIVEETLSVPYRSDKEEVQLTA